MKQTLCMCGFLKISFLAFLTIVQPAFQNISATNMGKTPAANQSSSNIAYRADAEFRLVQYMYVITDEELAIDRIDDELNSKVFYLNRFVKAKQKSTLMSKQDMIYKLVY